MTRQELLDKTFESAYAAMKELEDFLKEVDSSCEDENRGNHQDLRVVGTRIFGS